MAETDNLKLALPGSNEYVDVEVLNENFRKIDTSVLLALAAAAPYSAAATYAVGAYCTKGGKLYRCTVVIPQAEAWNAAHWAETTMGAELVAIYTTLANKAPGGFGLGGNAKWLTEADDVNAISESGWYAWDSPHTPKNAINLAYSTIMRVDAQNAVVNVKTIYGVAENLLGAAIVARNMTYGSHISDWEYENPPMTFGVEYRSTARYLGKPVYCMVVDCGTVPAVGSSKTIMVAPDAEIFSVSAYSPMRGLGIPFRDANGVKLEINQSGNTLIFSNYSETRSDTNALASVEYIKTTV